MIKVLTIEREYGSGAAGIAQQLSDRLGWKLWDQLLTNEIARRLECASRHIEEHEERKDPLYYRLFKAFMRGSYEGSLNAPGMKLADADGIRRITEQIVRGAGAEGNCVIVGRGSAYYLRDLPDAFHIFIYAPFEEKVRRLQQQGKSEEEAIHLAGTVDQDRAAFIKQYFGIEWPARQFFQLMINSTIGDAAAVQIILDGLSAIQKA
ncbi:MAG: cytidylate kinase-like family protein [Bryobacteraceae bacterium]|jgi:cytidylate kinase